MQDITKQPSSSTHDPTTCKCELSTYNPPVYRSARTLQGRFSFACPCMYAMFVSFIPVSLPPFKPHASPLCMS